MELTFLWPAMLGLLLLTPVLVLAYRSVQNRRMRLAEMFASYGQGPAGSANRPGLRRHIPPILFLAGIVLLIFALARPQATISLPRVEGTVILMFDVSGSMAAEDVEPNRIEAAKAAAREFITSQPESVQIGVVSFSDAGFAVQTPTNEQETLLSAINRLSPQRGTSLGQGILASLQTIAVDAGQEMPTPDPQAAPGAEEGYPFQIPDGSFPSAVIVVISDGENTERPDPLAAAQAAAERDVRIYTVGVGTAEGAVLEVEGFSVHTRLDEAVLRDIAAISGGTYSSGANLEELRAVYQNVVPRLVVKPEQVEGTALLAGASIVILLAASIFSVLWFSRIP